MPTQDNQNPATSLEDEVLLNMAETHLSLNSLGLKVNGKKKTSLAVASERELTEFDIASRNATSLGTAPPPIQRIRDSHHKVAELLALGVRCCEISAITGFSPSYISNLQRDSSMIELIEFYKGHAQSEFADVVKRLKMINLEITSELLTRLADHPEELSVGSLVELLKATLDRTGHSPVTKSVSLSGELTPGLLDSIKESARSVLTGSVSVI